MPSETKLVIVTTNNLEHDLQSFSFGLPTQRQPSRIAAGKRSTRSEMNSKIKIIKPAARNFTHGEPQTDTPEHPRDIAKIESTIQMARTIQEWVRERRQRASEELSAARLIKSSLS